MGSKKKKITKEIKEEKTLIGGIFSNTKDKPDTLIIDDKVTIETKATTEEAKPEVPESFMEKLKKVVLPEVDFTEKTETKLDPNKDNITIETPEEVDTTETPEETTIVPEIKSDVSIYKTLSEMSKVEYRRFRRTGIRAKK